MVHISFSFLAAAAFAAFTAVSSIPSTAKALNILTAAESNLSSYIPSSESYHPTQQDPANALRTYETAQGVLDITKLEVLLSQKLDSRVEIASIRWPYNPFDYTYYAVGGIVGYLTDWDQAQDATYVIRLRIGETHLAKCTLSLYPKAHEGTVWNCRSKTANIRAYEQFKFQEVGLPAKPLKPALPKKRN